MFLPVAKKVVERNGQATMGIVDDSRGIGFDLGREFTFTCWFHAGQYFADTQTPRRLLLAGYTAAREAGQTDSVWLARLFRPVVSLVAGWQINHAQVLGIGLVTHLSAYNDLFDTCIVNY